MFTKRTLAVRDLAQGNQRDRLLQQLVVLEIFWICG